MPTEAQIIEGFNRGILPPEMLARVEEGFRRGLLRDPRIPEPVERRIGGKGRIPAHTQRIFPSQKEVAKAVGFSTEGAPAAAREFIGFGASPGDPESDAFALSAGMKEVLGRDANVQFDTRFKDLTFETKSGIRSVANPSGLDIGDIRQYAGEGRVIAGDIAGGVFGAASTAATATPPAIIAGTAFGAGFGAFVGEVSRLQKGRAIGAHTLTDDEILERAAFVGGISVLGVGIGDTLFRVGRAMLGGTSTRRAVADAVDFEALEGGASIFEDFGKEFQRARGEVFPATVGDILRQAEPGLADDIIDAEVKISRRRPRGEIATLKKEQIRMVGELGKDTLGPREVTPIEPIVAGRMKRAITEPAAIGARTLDERVASAVERSQTAAISVTGGLVANNDIGAARTLLAESRDRFDDKIGIEFDTAIGEAANIPIDVSGVRITAKQLKMVSDVDLFPSLAPENRTLILDALKAGTKKRPGLQFGEPVDGGFLLEPVTKIIDVPVPLRVVQRALSDLKRELRRISKGESTRNRKDVINLIDALSVARKRSVPTDQLDEIVDVERRFKEFRINVDRSALGDLLKRNENGSFVLSDKATLNRIISNPEIARDILRVTQSQEMEAAGAKFAIRRALAQEFESRITAIDGTVSSAKLRTALKAMVPTLRVYFSPSEMKRFSANPRAAAKALQDAKDTQTRALTNLNRTLGTQLADIDPQNIVRAVMDRATAPARTATPKDIIRVDRILGRVDPSLRSTYREQLKREFRALVTNMQAGIDIISADKLAAVNPALINAFGDVFGTQWKTNFRLLQKAGQLAFRGVGFPGQLTEKITGGEAAKLLISYIRVPIGNLLSTRGRALRAIVETGNFRAERVLDHLLANPESLNRIAALRGKNLKGRVVFDVFAGLGFSEFGADIQDAINSPGTVR